MDVEKARAKAHRFGLATLDMAEAAGYINACERLAKAMFVDKTDEWGQACDGLLVAAVITYCRPFTKNFSASNAVARIGATELSSVQAHAELHDLLISRRNTVIAHADWSQRSIEILDATAGTVGWRAPVPDIWQGIKMQQFRALVQEVHDECQVLAFHLAQTAQGI